MFRELLARVVAESGAEYCCAADPVAGKVLAEVGDVDPAAHAALGWSSLIEQFLAGCGDELDDLIVTTRRAYHLVRLVTSAPAEPVLVYLRVDRRRGNLAVARRALATMTTAPAAAVPVQRGSPAPLGNSPNAQLNGHPSLPVAARSRQHPAALAGVGAGRQAESEGVAAVIALPRRRPAALPPPRLPPAPVATARPQPVAAAPAGGRWRTDMPTLQRLLQALQRFP